MKQFRIKQYSHNNLYCIQQRTGLFSWKTLETKTIRQHALNTLNSANRNAKDFEDFQIINFGYVNEAIVIIPTIAYHQKSLLFAWLNVAIGINF